jgi:glycosyltransferase involved in cell wall biosynthesis
LPLPNNCEWIIIDGDSSDETKVFLSALSEIEGIRYVSEKDNGMYDAMNKGILLAQGSYINFMNSGDYFISDSLSYVIKKRSFDNDITVFNYNVKTINSQDFYSRKFPDNVNEIKNWACFQHQSALIRRSIFSTLGLYSLSNKYLSDYEFFVKAYLNKNITISLKRNKKISNFINDGASSNLETASIIAKEYKKIQLKYFKKYNLILYITNNIKYLLKYLPFGKNLEFLASPLCQDTCPLSNLSIQTKAGGGK